MVGAKAHNKWQLLTARQMIESRVSVFCAEFGIERPLAKSLVGIELVANSVYLQLTLFTSIRDYK